MLTENGFYFDWLREYPMHFHVDVLTVFLWGFYYILLLFINVFNIKLR